jgi:transcriptional regulator with XRE-family HTH domain
VPGKRSTRPCAEELPELLRERSLSLRALAGMFGVGDDHLSRVVRGARGTRVSADLTRRVTKALNLAED